MKMRWKKWPYWLKGGVIGLGIFLILSILAIIAPRSDMGNIFYLVILVLCLPIYFLANIIQGFFSPHSIIAKLFGPITPFIILLIPYSFGLGSLIGFIYGKIKNRNQGVKK